MYVVDLVITWVIDSNPLKGSIHCFVAWFDVVDELYELLMVCVRLGCRLEWDWYLGNVKNLAVVMPDFR